MLCHVTLKSCVDRSGNPIDWVVNTSGVTAPCAMLGKRRFRISHIDFVTSGKWERLNRIDPNSNIQNDRSWMILTVILLVNKVGWPLSPWLNGRYSCDTCGEKFVPSAWNAFRDQFECPGTVTTGTSVSQRCLSTSVTNDTWDTKASPVLFEFTSTSPKAVLVPTAHYTRYGASCNAPYIVNTASTKRTRVWHGNTSIITPSGKHFFPVYDRPTLLEVHIAQRESSNLSVPYTESLTRMRERLCSTRHSDPNDWNVHVE